MREQNGNDKRLFLLDAMALIYRAYFAMIRNPLINSKGLNVSAISGFTNTLYDLLNREKPTHIAVVFDTFAPTDRSLEHDFYKANRQETPSDIIQSIPIIKEIISGFRIPCIEKDGYEADDIIATLAKKAEKESYEVYMITPDKDFGQVVSDKIFIYKPPYQGKGGFEKLGVKEVLERWEIDNISQVIDMLGLMGDSVDNIPGIPGVGEKTASKLLKEFGSIENLLDNTDQIKGKLREKIEENKELAIISKKLATIHCEVPVDFKEDELIMEEPDRKKLSELFNDLEFRSIGKRILGDEFAVAPTSPAPSGGQMDLFGVSASGPARETAVIDEPRIETKTKKTTSNNYVCADTSELRMKLVQDFLTQPEFSFDTETTGIDPMSCDLVGLSFSCRQNEAYYVPVPANKEKAQEILKDFIPLFSNGNILKVGHDIKFDILVMRRYGIFIQGPYFDTMVAHYLLEPDMRHQLDFLSESYLGYSPVAKESLIGKGRNQLTMRDVEMDKVVEYSAEDADIALQLKRLIEPSIPKHNLEHLLYNIELPLMSVLADMEYEGVALDIDFLNNYSKELEEQIKCFEDNIFSAAGVKFNLDSPKQLGEILFVKLELPYKGKKTKTGQFSTGEEILSKLAEEFEICGSIMSYRELVKLKSTYVDALPNLVNPDTGRIHTTFKQTVANTGRLSSQYPNLQNIPIKTEKGREIRKAFIPRDENHVLLAADYSQIELRIIAALSGDEAMLEAFEKGIDIHTATAAKVYGLALEDVTREIRNTAKAVNFGIVYGISAFGLSQNLNISRSEAQDLINAYFKQYPMIRKYMSDSINKAKDCGYAETILGRKKYLSDINARNITVRGFAERNSINMPIQGSAADMIKVAMVNIHKAFEEQNLKSKMTLQVHDELVFDAHKDELEIIKPIIEQKMKTAIPQLKVPIVVELGVGSNWLEAH